MTLYVKQSNMLFVHTPKTGGTSIKTWIRENFEDSIMVDRVHSTYHETIDKVPTDTFSFSVCRDPWDRQVSHYFYNIENTQGRIEAVKNGHVNKPHKVKWNLQALQTYLAEIIDGGFAHFTRNKELWYMGDFSAFSTQASVIGDCDLVLRFENLEEEFKQIQEMTGCYVPLPITNTTSHKYYKEYYDSQDLIDCVADHFAEDIKKFNYVF